MTKLFPRVFLSNSVRGYEPVGAGRSERPFQEQVEPFGPLVHCLGVLADGEVDEHKKLRCAPRWLPQLCVFRLPHHHII